MRPVSFDVGPFLEGRKMNKFLKFTGAALLCLWLAACGGGSSSDNSTSATPTPVPTSTAATPTPTPATGGTTPVTIHMLGDSTMTAYTEDRRPQMGWGEKMPMFFNSNVTVKNWALGGRSSRSFYYESTRWPAILPQINAGDYVIIQFGHNDQKYGADYSVYGTYAYCSDGSTDGEACTGGTDAVDATVAKDEHSYYQFLKRYVTEVKAKGAYPILMSPMVRKYFSGTTITAEGQHNVAIKGTETSARGDYPAAMKAVATKYNVPFIDLTTETKTIVENYGITAATDLLYISADSTHPQVLFATLIAKKASEGMKSQNLLKDYMVEATSLVANPSTLAWNTRYITTSSTKTITVSAFDLTPAAGTVTVTSPSSSFELSTDQTTWSSSLTIDYTNNAFTKTVYVRFTPTAVQDYSANITFTLAGATVGTVAASGSGVSAGSGVDSYATWFTAGTSLTGIIDGLLTADDAIATGLNLTTSKVLQVEGQDTSPARFTVDTWTARSSAKYLEFAAKPSGTFSVTGISAYLTSSGGSTVQADIEYSADGTNWTKLNSTALAFTKDVMTKVDYTVTASVPSTGKLYIRIYPWNTAGNTGKSLAVYGVKMTGKVSTN